MTGRRAIVGLCMLCALMVSAIAAQGASAAEETAVTCKEPVAGDTVVGSGTFAKEHCTAADKAAGGKFQHVEIAENTETELSGTNTKTGTESEATFLHSVQSGVEEELKATEVTGTGTMVNKKNAKGEMIAHGEGVITYKGVTVVKPAGKGCTVAGGEVKTNTLTATTEGAAAQTLTFSPGAGAEGVFAKFTIEGCSVGVLNGLYEVKGSVASTKIDGATTTFERTPTTNQTTLKVRGQNAGLAGLLTIKGRDKNIVGDTFRPLALTP
jgi:hypothetical protein